MCLAIPAKVVEINEGMGIIDMEGTRRKVSLLLQDDIKVGDYVMVHAGFVIQKVDEEVAKDTLNILKEIAEEVEKENSS